MRIARYAIDGGDGPARLGVVGPDGIHPMPQGTELAELLASGPVPGADAPVPLDRVRLLPPLHPASIRDFVTFEQHVEGLENGTVPEGWYQAPTFLFMSPHSVIGAHDPVAAPPGCELLDYELEVAVVIGRDGRDLTPEQAAAHIAGYTIFNDWSARDIQRREMAMRLGPAKAKDFASTLGPYLVTPDELEPFRRGDRLDLEMTVQVNGRHRGGDRLSNMAWSFPELISYASRGAWVRAGDVIGSGTCGGGALAESWGRTGRIDPPPLQPGDVVTMEVEGLGTISNRVAEPSPAAAPVPGARRRRAARGTEHRSSTSAVGT